MGDTSHLERMGRELKCPICLSLLNSAASLTCNHVFCNACIVKSMKTDATCPVCKIPYHRRDIRAAPHMDSLVGIYKSMKGASGVDTFLSQNIPSSNKPSDGEKHIRTYSKCTKKATNEICQVADQGQTFKGKVSRKTKDKNLDAPAPIVLKPSSQTKKRVQLQQRPPSTTATEDTESIRRVEKFKDNNEMTLIASNENPSPNKAGRFSLSPFFWLRDEDDEEHISQFTESDLNCTPPDAPSFSDLKDSDHETPTKACEQEKPAPMDMFDSEMIKWTQRPCSPEILPSPVKAKIPDIIESDQCRRRTSKVASAKSTSRKREAGNARNKIAKLGSGASEVSPAGVNLVDKQASTGASNRKNQKSNENAKELAKRCEDHCSDVQTGGKISKESDGQAGVIYRKKGTKRKRSTSKASEDQPVAKSSELPLGREVIGNGDQKNQVQGLCDAEPEKQSSAGNFLNKKRGRKSNATPLTAKGSANDNPAAKRASKLTPSLTSSRLKQSRLRDKLTAKVHTTEIQQNCLKPSPGHDLPLRQCKILANKSPCAFCHSSEDSEASGEMAHYCKGQPVSADFDGGSRVIHVHKNCAEWAPNVYFEDLTVVNLEAELTRSKRIICSCCGLKGAALGCYHTICNRSFHVPCAKLVPECRWDLDNFVMLCPLHATSKLPCEETVPKQRRHKPTQSGQLHSESNQVGRKIDAAPQVRRLQELSKKLVLCCSGLTLQEKTVVSEFSKLPGVVVLRKWEPTVTHVIASTDENGACKRTLKVLMGISEGKWILSIDWVKACMKDMKCVDEEQYEITKDVHGTQNGPRIGRQRALNKQPKLFEGVKFFIGGDFDPAYKGYLQDLVVAAGGTILRRRPITGQANEFNALSESSMFIVYSNESSGNRETKEKEMLSRRQSDAEALAKSCGSRAVSSSWIMDSIAASKLQILD